MKENISLLIIAALNDNLPSIRGTLTHLTSFLLIAVESQLQIQGVNIEKHNGKGFFETEPEAVLAPISQKRTITLRDIFNLKCCLKSTIESIKKENTC